MKVLVCGDREWTASGMVYAALDELQQNVPDLEVISGMARGADSHAARWAQKHGANLHAFPADWKKFGKRAGPIRNQRMLTEGHPDLVLAFHDRIDESRGTKHMVTIAERAGVQTILIRHPEKADA